MIVLYCYLATNEPEIVPHESTFADGKACQPTGTGPFLQEYSFLERPDVVPGNFAAELKKDDVASWLINRFLQKDVVDGGGRAWFGFDANAKSCGDFTFPGHNGKISTTTMFFAAKQDLNHPVLGRIQENMKHLVISVRNETHTLYRCTYDAPPPGSTPSPSPSPTPSVTPSQSEIPSPTPSPSVSFTPSPSASQTPTQSATPSVSASPSLTSSSTPFQSVTPSPTPSLSFGASVSPSPSATNSMNIPTPSPSYIHNSGPFNQGTNVQQPNGATGCFPASAMVEMSNGIKKSMGEVQIGDLLRVSKTEFSPVFMFTHRKHSGYYDFLRFNLVDGRSISMTPGHSTYSNGILKHARHIQVGDLMGNATVLSILPVSAVGLINPQTEHGDIIVNGVRTSTYTDAIYHSAAHPLLAPLRFLYRMTGLRVTMIEDGWNGLISSTQ